MPHGAFAGFISMLGAMNAMHKKAPLTLGEFIMGVYDACDEHRARVIVWLAINAHLVACRARLPSDPHEGPAGKREMYAELPDDLLQQRPNAGHRRARWFE
jgi:hypothetical protein